MEYPDKNVKVQMYQKLQDALAPLSLEIIDESDQHAGHMLHPGGVEPRGETHFRIRVVSPVLEGKSRLVRHRLIHTALADELAHGVHALAIEASAPGEKTRR
ncbi:MAG: BolA family transcriptional regulator [Beijerinckiaceae bacterium]|nr:BolA family transcriptional regulator [Beijerinckiaceae bacterium]